MWRCFWKVRTTTLVAVCICLFLFKGQAYRGAIGPLVSFCVLGRGQVRSLAVTFRKQTHDVCLRDLSSWHGFDPIEPIYIVYLCLWHAGKRERSDDRFLLYTYIRRRKVEIVKEGSLKSLFFSYGFKHWFV